jgi:hypothetical protein
MWDFIWEGKVNQIKRDVCCLDIENGGMSMVNLDSYIDSRRIPMLGLIFDRTRDTCLNLRMKHLSICK